MQVRAKALVSQRNDFAATNVYRFTNTQISTSCTLATSTLVNLQRVCRGILVFVMGNSTIYHTFVIYFCFLMMNLTNGDG